MNKQRHIHLLIKMNKSEKDVLKTLLKLTSTFSVSPSYNFIRYNTRDPFLKYHLFTIFCAIVSVIAYSVYLQNAIQTYYANEKASVLRTLLDILATLSYVVSGLITFSGTIIHREAWKNFFRSLQDVSKELGSGVSCYTSTSKKRLLFDVFILIGVFSFKIFWNIFVWVSEEDIESYMFYIPLDLIEYFTLISLLLLVYLNKIIRQRYIFLNNFTRQTWSSRYSKNENIYRRIQVNYRKLGKLINLLNRIFGYQMLLTVTLTVISILESFYYALSEESYLIISWCVVSTAFALVSFFLIKRNKLRKLLHYRI